MPTHGPFFHSSGLLVYSKPTPETFKLIVEVDPDISHVARALAPKSAQLQPQRYPPHITVVRNEVPPKIDMWGALKGMEIEFDYSPIVHTDGRYYWLIVLAPKLHQIRVELGLPPSSKWTRPPDDMAECFHCTVGNTKHLNIS
jgi:hypothetical protein